MHHNRKPVNRFRNGQHESKGGIRNGHHNNNISPSSSFSSIDRSEDPLPMPSITPVTASAAIALLSLLCFSNSYDGEFVFDDSEAIIGNKDLTPEVPLQSLFVHDFWGNRLASNTSHKSYRPLNVLTFRLNYLLSGGLNPLGFHLTNIILHGVVSVTLYFTCNTLLNDISQKFYWDKTSFLVAVLFAVHPIHTESVSGIVGRADMMCALCTLVALSLYIKSCHKDEDGYDFSSSISLLSSIIVCGLSVLFKEQGITVLGLCSAYDILVFCRIDLVNTIGLRNTTNNNNEKTKGHAYCRRSLIWRHFILTIGGLIILKLRWWVMGATTPTFQVVDNPHSFVNGTILRAINYNYIYSLNTWLLINPWWLCFDWSMGCVPVIESYTDVRIICIFMLWLVLGSIIYWCLKEKPGKERRMLMMGLAFLILPFLPATNLFFRVGFVVAERILYIPSIGYCIVITLGLHKLCVKFHNYHKIIQWCFVMLLVVYTIRSMHRSNDWRKEKLLFESGADVCPLNAKVHYNIAKLRADEGDIDFAIEKYRHAIQLNKDYDQAMNNLANILKDRGQLTEAEHLLEKAVNIRSDFAAAWMNLAIVQSALLKNSSAEYSYKTALKHRKKYPDCYYNLGNLYLSMGRNAEALTSWRNATLQKPKHISAWSNMILLLDSLERWSEIDIVAKEAIHHNPDEGPLYYNYANALGKANRYEEAETNFMRAIQLAPTVTSHYTNLGVLYHRWKKHDKAEVYYKKALSIDPTATHVQNYLQMLAKARQKQGTG